MSPLPPATEAAADFRPCIPPPWRIRNDGRYVVVYECATGSLKHRVLSPVQAMLAPFMDGSYSAAELIGIGENLLGGALGARCGEIDLDWEVRCLQQAEWISDGGPPSPSLTGDRSSLVPDFRRYEPPSRRLDRPLAITATLTHYCRTDCIYCYAERRVERELGFDEWVRLFDEARANEIFSVDPAGGDIFARKDGLRLLTEMARREFTFFVSTKCPIARDLAEALADIGVGRLDGEPHLRRDLQFSVDSVDPVVADRLVGRRNYLQRANDSVRNCIAAGLSPRVKSVLTSLNADAAMGIVGHFAALGVRRFHFVQYGRTHFRHDDGLFLTAAQKAALPDQLAAIRDRFPECDIQMQIESGDATTARKQNWGNRASCSGGRLQMVVKPDGDVTLCDQIPQTDEFVVGNVRESGLMGAWTSPRVEAFLTRPRDAFVGKPCAACGEFDRCHSASDIGYCFRDSLFAFGNILEAPPSCPRQSQVGLRQI